VEWRAFELHPEIPPQGLRLPPHVRDQLVGMSEHLKEMALEAGMQIVMPDLIPNSRRALEAAEYSRQEGKHEAFHRAIFRKLYGEGQNIHDWDVLRAAAEEAGLDPDVVQRETERGAFRAEVDRQTAEAWALGITGVPAYIFNEKYAIIGAQPYEVFQQTVSRLEAENADQTR
jgi:predicted DsbA family dithiol-disulfide isomerase